MTTPIRKAQNRKHQAIFVAKKGARLKKLEQLLDAVRKLKIERPVVKQLIEELEDYKG